MISPEAYVAMYNEYKQKLSEKPYNKWNQFKIEMPLDWATEIAKRTSSYG